jgi:hypothetical protein
MRNEDDSGNHPLGGEQPTLLHVLSHDCYSLETVRAAPQAVIEATDVTANGYRITTESGDELFGSQRSTPSQLS